MRNPHGIWDTPYDIPGTTSTQDLYPLVNEYSDSVNIISDEESISGSQQTMTTTTTSTTTTTATSQTATSTPTNTTTRQTSTNR